SKYSIHDLSRFTGEGLDNFARFNMPLELGVALALRHERQNTAKPHNFLVLVTGAYEYQKFVSDLAGFDPCRHESTVRSVVREVASWLLLQEDLVRPVPSASAILSAFAKFELELAQRRCEALDKLTWPDILGAASATLPVPE
ncbi:MAG: hypothetical protein JOY85_12795, partial [Acidobacteriaceae bacterium]|nr:hypothetical protein [Acidobacteriaceae bacterium]